jgi:hypothetical protein
VTVDPRVVNSIDILTALRRKQFPTEYDAAIQRAVGTYVKDLATPTEPDPIIPLTVEQRFQMAQDIADQQEAERQKEYVCVGGDKHTPRSCLTCKFWDKYDSPSRAECHNKAASLKGTWIKNQGLRGPMGLCGPEGLYWEDMTPKSTPVPIPLAAHYTDRRLRHWPILIVLFWIAVCFFTSLL